MVECCFTPTETVDLLGTGSQDGHLDFHTAPELWEKISRQVGIISSRGDSVGAAEAGRQVGIKSRQGRQCRSGQAGRQAGIRSRQGDRIGGGRQAGRQAGR